MNKPGKYTNQKGFFDLGISLILLTIFGTTAVIVDANQDESEPQQMACADFSHTQTRNRTECQ